MKKLDQILVLHGTHMSQTNSTSTPPFVILVLIYEWEEKK
jgi:hypothetical protein